MADLQQVAELQRPDAPKKCASAFALTEEGGSQNDQFSLSLK